MSLLKKMKMLVHILLNQYFSGCLILSGFILSMLSMFGLSSFISPAFAEPATTAGNTTGSSSATTAAAANTGPSSAISQGLLFGAFILIFYFFIIRPQSKRAKQQRDLITSIQKGDEVLTNGGLIGKITKVTDNFFVVMIAEGTEVLVQKQAIAGSLPKGTMKSI